jgi:hypothetical protein
MFAASTVTASPGPTARAPADAATWCTGYGPPLSHLSPLGRRGMRGCLLRRSGLRYAVGQRVPCVWGQGELPQRGEVGIDRVGPETVRPGVSWSASCALDRRCVVGGCPGAVAAHDATKPWMPWRVPAVPGRRGLLARSPGRGDRAPAAAGGRAVVAAAGLRLEDHEPAVMPGNRVRLVARWRWRGLAVALCLRRQETLHFAGHELFQRDGTHRLGGPRSPTHGPRRHCASGPARPARCRSRTPCAAGAAARRSIQASGPTTDTAPARRAWRGRC